MSNGTGDKPKKTKHLEQRLTFWGVRGTLPTPGTETLHYGGNTSCVEATNHDHQLKKKTTIILDAGTGLANFGEAALDRGDREFHIILSHMHYDHMIGFLRFKPFFRSDCRHFIYGQGKCGLSLQQIFERFFGQPFFPLSFDQIAASANTTFVDLNGVKELEIEGTKVQFEELNHPQDAIASRVWSFDKSTSVVYATDHEHGTDRDANLVAFSQGASLLLYDSTYSESEFGRYTGWGHSTPAAGARIAKEAGVAAYGLFHHDPESSDSDLESSLLPEAKQVFRRSFLAVENQTICLTDLPNILKRDRNSRVG